MCIALRELMRPEIEEEMQEKFEQGMERGIKCGIEQGMERGVAEATIRAAKKSLLRGLEKKEIIQDIYEALSPVGMVQSMEEAEEIFESEVLEKE